MWLDENPNPARAVTNWSRGERCVMLSKYENGSRHQRASIKESGYEDI